jgi:putative ABC transport system permease protein
MSFPNWSFRRRRREEELDEEVRAHLRMAAQEHAEQGESAEQARAAAECEFGNVTLVKEVTRDMWGRHWFETLLQDLRYGTRQLRKKPSFTIVAVLTLALGIGATTAIFSVVYAVLLRPLPYQDPSTLVVMQEMTPKVGTVSVSYQDFLDWRRQSHAFSRMAAVHSVGFNLAGVSQPETISGDAVSPNFLSMEGIRPFLGRDFDSAEEKAGAAPVVILSYPLWQSHLGGDPNAIGRTITLDGRSFTIVGVLSPSFRSLDKTDLLEPIGVWATNNPNVTERGERGDTVVIGRLAAGVTLPQARAEMEGIAARLAEEYPGSNDQFGVSLESIRDAFVSDSRPAILVLFGAVVFVLLIACANVANLYLVHAAARIKEIALRMALGAERSRIIRQMLTESFVLAGLGGILGVALAVGGIQAITRLIPMDMLSGESVSLSGAVLLFAAGTVVLTAVVFGLAPAAHSTRPDVQSELKEGGRTTSAGSAQNRLRAAFAIAEISLALILLVSAGLMTKSLYRLMDVNPGFQPDRVLTMELDLRTQQYSKDPAILNFWEQLLAHVQALPGVESVAVGTVVPLSGDHSRGDITIEGMALPKPGSFPHPDYHIVSPGYLRTLGVPLLRGRQFTEADNEKSPLVGMVNAKLASEYWPNDNPLGKRFIFGHPDPKKPSKCITVVGVTGDTKLYGLANPPRLELYIPYRQDPTGGMNLLTRSAIDPASLTSEIRGAVASIDKDQPIFGVTTMEQLVSNSVATQRITLVLLGLFSGLALVLAVIGVYGVISYSVAQRTHEIGIRMALGAERQEVLKLVVGHSLRLTLMGVGLGIIGALVLTRTLASLLYTVKPTDVLTFVIASLLLSSVALVASYIPARRAAKVDPMVALRYE